MSPKTKTALCLVAVVAAATLVGACGKSHVQPLPTSSSRPTGSGVFGIVLTNRGGLRYSEPPPSPLPGGFGMSTSVPDSEEAVTVKALSGENAGKVVALIKPDHQGLFTLALPPGSYSLCVNSQQLEEKTRVIVVPGTFARAVVQGMYRY